MTQTHVAVVGVSGMLGSMLVDYLDRDPTVSLVATVRNAAEAARGAKLLPRVTWRTFDAVQGSEAQLGEAIRGARWVVNAIGTIKQHVKDHEPDRVEQAVLVNAVFPARLARAAATHGATVLQIATDCVYSGFTGGYDEAAPHDALDVYGKSKSLGESFAANVFNLRCSIIGPETRTFVSLLDWFRKQPRGASLRGYTNHTWNGVTTLHFAKLCRGLMDRSGPLPHVHHLTPSGTVSKHEMLLAFAAAYDRADLTITPHADAAGVKRTLTTKDPTLNAALWTAAGYARPPTVPEMIRELAAFDYRMTGAFD